MKKKILGFIVSILVFAAAFVLPVGSGLSLLMIIVGIFGAIGFGIRILVSRGVTTEFEGGGMRMDGQHKSKRVAMEKIDTGNVWDTITNKDEE